MTQMRSRTFAFIELRKLSVNIRWPIAVDSKECCDLICDSWKQRRSCRNIWVNADESESCGEENWGMQMWMSPDNLCYMIIWVIHSAIHGFSTSRRILLNADLQQWNGFVDKRVRCAEILAQAQSSSARIFVLFWLTIKLSFVCCFQFAVVRGFSGSFGDRKQNHIKDVHKFRSSCCTNDSLCIWIAQTFLNPPNDNWIIFPSKSFDSKPVAKFQLAIKTSLDKRIPFKAAQNRRLIK